MKKKRERERKSRMSHSPQAVASRPQSVRVKGRGERGASRTRTAAPVPHSVEREQKKTETVCVVVFVYHMNGATASHGRSTAAGAHKVRALCRKQRARNGTTRSKTDQGSASLARARGSLSLFEGDSLDGAK